MDKTTSNLKYKYCTVLTFLFENNDSKKDIDGTVLNIHMESQIRICFQ